MSSLEAVKTTQETRLTAGVESPTACGFFRSVMAPPEVLYVLVRLLTSRGIDMTRQREIARMAHTFDRRAALWLGSADAETYRATVEEARQIAAER
jgi:hypothetical protein